MRNSKKDQANEETDKLAGLHEHSRCGLADVLTRARSSTARLTADVALESLLTFVPR